MLDVFMETAAQEYEQPAVLSLFSEQSPQRNERYNNQLALELSSLRALRDPSKTFYDLYDASKSEVHAVEDPRALFAKEAEYYKGVQFNSIKDAAVRRIKAGEDAGSVLRHVALTKELFDESDAWDTQALITSAQSAMPLDAWNALNKAADASPFRLLMERNAKEGRDGLEFEDFQDWASVFVIPDNTINDMEVFQAVNKSGVLRATSLADVGNKYKGMNPIEKERFWGTTFEALYSAYDGNVPKIAMAISRIQAFDPEMEVKINTALDYLIAVGGVADAHMVFKAAEKLAGLTKTKLLRVQKNSDAVTALRNAGQNGLAADAALTRAAESGDVVSAAKNASPYNFEGTVLDGVHVVDGLAPEIQQRLKDKLSSVRTTEELLAQTQRATLEQKAHELDIWVDDEIAALGGRKEADLLKERAAIETRIHEVSSSRDRGAKTRAKELRKQLNKINALLATKERTSLAKDFAKRMRRGEVPEEFSSDVRAAQGAVLRAWEDAPSVQKVRRPEQLAQDAEIAKMRAELGVELQGYKRLDKAAITSMKVRSAQLVREIHAANTAGDTEKVAALEKERAELRAAFDEHQNALTTERQLVDLDNRELNPDQRARLRDVVKAAKTKPVAEVAGTAPSAPVKYSMNPNADAAIQAGVDNFAQQLEPYRTGDGFINVARTQFARAAADAERVTYSKSGRSVRHVELVGTDKDGIELRYVLEDGAETKTYKWNQDSLGKWDVSSMNDGLRAALSQAASYVLSPDAVFRKIDRDVVKNMTLGGMQSAAIHNNIMRIAQNISKDLKLNKESVKRVQDLLILGDAKGEVYAADSLLHTNLINSTQYSPEEVMAYFQWRKLYDTLWEIQNSAVQRSLSFQGYREVRVVSAEGRVEGVLREIDAGMVDNIAGLRLRDGVHEETNVTVLVLDDLAQNSQQLGRASLKDLVTSKGYRLYEVHGGKLGEHRARYAAIREGEKVTLHPLRKHVLHRPIGYIPRVSKPGMFFVKDKNFSTIAGFDGRKEALDWVRNQGKLGEWEVHADRALPPESIEIDRVQSMGGLWYDHRRSDPLMNPNTKKMLHEDMDLGNATQSYLATVSEMLPLNEYRSAVWGQFRDAVKAVASKNGKEGFLDPTDVVNSKISTGSNSSDAILENTRKYLIQQLATPTIEEGAWSRIMGSAIDLMEGKKLVGGTPRNVVRWARVQSPLARAKAAVFHAYLGSMNFAQLFVQAQNATIAASVYPQHALQATYDAMKMRTVLFMDDEAVRALSLSSNIEMNTAKAEAAAMLRSGYLDSIYRQGDFRTQLSGLGGSTLQAARKALRAGAIPFEEGELFARLVSFNIAKRVHLSKNPGLTKFSDLDIQSIVQESLRINLNLQKENAAMWQSNWLTAVPTQFLQVQAKFLENVAGGLIRDTGTKTGKHTGLTRGEAARVLGGQLAVYGMVGVPLYETVMHFVAKNTGHVQPDGSPDVQGLLMDNPDAARVFSEGAMGLALHAFGFNINVAERFSIPAGFDDNVVISMAEMILSTGDPSTRPEFSLQNLAPGIGVAVRVRNAVDEISDRLWAMFHAPESTPEQLWESVKAVANIASSWNNYDKLALWRAHGLTYSRAARGNVRWKDQEMNFQTQLAKALGFETDSEFLTWQASDDLRSIENLKDRTKFLLRKSYLLRSEGDSALADVLLNDAEKLLDNPTQFRILQRDAFDELYNSDATETRVKGKLFKEVVKGYNAETNLSELTK